jgi:RND family efflux transporter MFP subunit
MFRKYALPILAVAGILFGIQTVIRGNRPVPVAQPVSQPAEAPFQSFIAGAGIVEAKSQNIAIGTALPGIVKNVFVKVGDTVKAGQPLFQIDDREALAELGVRRAALLQAKAGVLEAQATLKDAETMRQLAEAVSDRRAISTEDLDRRRNAVMIAKARVGTAQAQVAQAEAQLKSTQTTLDRLLVRAPVEGHVLQVNERPGEFAMAGPLATPLMVLGNLDRLNIRVDIDENDAWRFRREARAVAFLRGNRAFRVDLKLSWVEPFVLPKKSLTGDSTERVDTRVLQVVYSFDPNQLHAFVGQQMDVFIEAPEGGTGTRVSPPRGNP